jgi:hypothetical protein
MPKRAFFIFLLVSLHLISYRAFAISERRLCRMALNTELSAKLWAASEIEKINGLLNFDPETRTIKTDKQLWSYLAQEMRKEENALNKESTINRTFDFERTKARARALVLVREILEYKTGPENGYKVLILNRLRILTDEIYKISKELDGSLNRAAVTELTQEMKALVFRANDLKVEVSDPYSELSPRASRAILRELECSNNRCNVREQNLRNTLRKTENVLEQTFRRASAFEMALSELLSWLQNPVTPTQQKLAELMKESLEQN